MILNKLVLSAKATLVTVPEVAGEAQTGRPPDTVRTCPVEPIGRFVAAGVLFS